MINELSKCCGAKIIGVPTGHNYSYQDVCESCGKPPPPDEPPTEAEMNVLGILSGLHSQYCAANCGFQDHTMTCRDVREFIQRRLAARNKSK